MDYYYISRKTPKGDEHLHITDGGRHDWRTSTAKASLLNKDKAFAKLLNLRTKGRKDCCYYVTYAYRINHIF
jgi:hypothetical protein